MVLPRGNVILESLSEQSDRYLASLQCAPSVMAAPTDSFPAGPLAAASRHTRTSFPPVDPPSDPDSFGDHSSIGLGPPPRMRRTSTGLEVGTSNEYRAEGRRRVKSAHVPSALSGRPQPQRHAQTVRRVLTTSEAVRPLKYERARWNAASVDSSLDELEPGVFSDEYDLCASERLSKRVILGS